MRGCAASGSDNEGTKDSVSPETVKVMADMYKRLTGGDLAADMVDVDMGSAEVGDSTKAALGQAAAVILNKSKAVLTQKLTTYNAQLKEVEQASDSNLIWKAVNRWTMRVLQRKIDFIMQRLQAILAIETAVESCSLDGSCRFELRASADPQEAGAINSAFTKTLPDMLESAAKNGRLDSLGDFVNDVAGRLQNSKGLDITLEQYAAVPLPPLIWSDSSEARELEEALVAAYRQAGGIPGATVKLEKSYGLAKGQYCVEQAKLGDAWKGLGQVDPDTGASVLQVSTYPWVQFVSGIGVVAISTWLAGSVGWLLGLEDPMRNMHWDHLVPLSLGEVGTLALWTAPVVGVYALLALVRENLPQLQRSNAADVLSAVADLLQSQRYLRYSMENDEDDMRVLYFIGTCTTIALSAPWCYGLLPSLSARIAQFSMGIDLTDTSSAAPIMALLITPLAALGAAAILGAWQVLADKANDKLGPDQLDDDTKVINDLFQNALMGFDESIGLRDSVEVKDRIGLISSNYNFQPTGSKDGRDAVDSMLSQPPNVVTMDFASASLQAKLNQQQEWIVPTVMMATGFYYILETLLTGQVTNAVITQIAAMSAMDTISTPWNRCSTRVSVEVKQPVKRVKVGKIKFF